MTMYMHPHPHTPACTWRNNIHKVAINGCVLFTVIKVVDVSQDQPGENIHSSKFITAEH